MKINFFGGLSRTYVPRPMLLIYQLSSQSFCGYSCRNQTYNYPKLRGASLFYTNFWNSKLILHKAITGLGSEWWPTTRPKALLPSVDNLHWYPFLIRARRHKALSWGNNGMAKICYCLTRMSSSSLGAFHNRRLPRTLSGIN